MTPLPSLRFRPAGAVGLSLLVLLAGTACHDAASDALVTVTTQETAPALEIRTDFHTLPDVLAEREGTPEVDRLVEDWELSWEHWNGSALRNQARLALWKLFSPEEAEAAAAAALPGLDWTKNTELIVEMARPVAVAVVQARRLVLEAEAALASGYYHDALVSYLTAADRVYAVSAPGVARQLVWRSEEALERWERRADAGSAPAPGELDRARHLVNGARRALEEGDHPRAIQRAHYAGQILGALTENVDGAAATRTPAPPRPGPTRSR